MDLRANAIITAVDRFSGPVRRMSSALNGMQGRAASLMTTTQNAARSAGRAAPMVATQSTVAAGLLLRGEYEVDRLSRQMQSVGELSEAERKMLVDNAHQTSVAIGQSASELIEAQRELIQGGLDAETTARTIDLVGKAAKSNAMGLTAVSEDAINVARGLGFAFDTVEEKTASLTKALNFMSVVPALSTESWEGLRESLRYAAPVANMLKIDIEELGAALSVLADRGFKGEQGGTAFRTILLRGIAPTRKLRDAYRAAGIQIEDLYNLDHGMIDDSGRLRERLLGAGFAGREEEIDAAIDQVGKSGNYDGLYAYQDALQASLVENLDADTADQRRIIKKAIDQHVFSALKDFDLEKFFESIAKLPLADFKEVAGIQRTSQARALMDDFSRIAGLVRHFEKLIPDAVERRFDVMDKGFAQSVDRVMAIMRRLRHDVFDSGLGDDLTGWLDSIGQAVSKFSKTDPEALSTLAKGGLLTALAAGIAAIASSPIAAAVAGVTALAAIMQKVDPDKGVIGTAFANDGQPGSTAGKPAPNGFWDFALGRPGIGRHGPGWQWWENLNRKTMEMPTVPEIMFGRGAKNIWGQDITKMRLRALNETYGYVPPQKERMDFGQGMIRDIVPEVSTPRMPAFAPADLSGTISGQVKVDVEVKVEGGKVVDKRVTGGELTGTLKKGKTMPDIGGPR